MKKVFEKYETFCCLTLIVLYLVINSICINEFGILDYRTCLTNTLISFGLVLLMLVLDRTKYYGLTRIKNTKKYLYFIPLLLIPTVNLWNGININNTNQEILFHIVNMLNVGFIEEIIFRGFLFKMMEKSNVKTAIIVSSLTFGVGHIINLLNGAEFIQTIIQIGYATAIGYLFVIIFYKSKSLIPCIITHSLTNSLSIFNVDNNISLYIAPIFLIIIPTIYAMYINNKVKGEKE